MAGVCKGIVSAIEACVIDYTRLVGSRIIVEHVQYHNRLTKRMYGGLMPCIPCDTLICLFFMRFVAKIWHVICRAVIYNCFQLVFNHTV